MALPPPLRASIVPAELELVATETLVDIIPLVSMERTAFISGAFCPLRPPAKASVPLWMAINLKQKKKCHIIPPDWLTVEYLQERLNEETSNTSFSNLPFRFAEIAKVILDSASDDIQSPEKIRSLLKDLREARQAKSREGLRELDHSDLSLPNLCSMEINEIRPFFVRAMGILGQLRKEPAATTGDSSGYNPWV